MLELRAATVDDCELILKFICDLAQYEKLRHEVTATVDQIRQSLFSTPVRAEVVIALWSGAPAGFALFFHNYSTFLAKPGLFLEDLFVDPAFRGKGIGKALLTHLAEIATARGCGRMEWHVLDWNESAAKFYESLGARPIKEWVVYRMNETTLEALSDSNRR